MKRDYRLVTPWKYNVSLGYTVGTSLALGAEYEYEDYSTMKFKYQVMMAVGIWNLRMLK